MLRYRQLNSLTTNIKVKFLDVSGRALENTAIYLLDDQLRLVSAGERGEIYAAGLNVARGYVNNRDPSRFLPNPVTRDPGILSIPTYMWCCFLNQNLLKYLSAGVENVAKKNAIVIIRQL
jgi:non-ribosomal peptide synthetase component F